MLPRFSALLAWALLACRFALAIPTIEIKGSKFFTSDGDQFYIKGVAYAPGGSSGGTNQLVNGDQCKIDAKLIGALGANVVRVYSVDPTLNHDACMNAFADNGIYVILDMSTPNYQINRADPDWTIDLRNAFAQVIDGFQGYDNLLAFFAGNEIINDQSTSKVAPYAKAVVADMKAYRILMQYRKIPIGYSAADLSDLRKIQQDYFDCGDEKTAVDFYGFNNYAWCSPSSFTESGYDQLYDDADGYDIPIFLSETGCNINTTRTWDDQATLLGREMNDRYSGNIIYEWTEEESGYGLASYSSGSAVTPTLNADYSRLKSQWATLSPTGVKATAYNPSLTKRACPTFQSSTWLVQKDATLPTLGTSGFTAPTTTRSASGTATGTGGKAGGGIAAETGTGVASVKPQDSNTSSKTPVGAIAGGVLGGLVVLALILGAILFFLRRKRKQREAAQAVENGSAPRGAESDKMVVTDEQDKIQQNGYYGPNPHELPVNAATQELDPARGHIAPFPAPEMASGHPTGDPAGEARGHVQSSPPNSHSPVSAARPEPSPYVEAQRRTEMEWLEGEEARLRQRRELLMRQNGGSGS